MKTPPLVTKIGDWLTPARTALAQVRDAVEAKAREVATLEAQKTALLSLRAPRTDLEARLDAEIATLGRLWATGKSADLVGTLSGHIDMTMQGEVQPTVAYDVPLVSVLGELSVPALCFLMPEMMKTGLGRLLDAAGEYDVGPPMAGRVARLREVQAAIAALEAQHQNLVDAAGELGLTIPPLEANRARQLRAQHQREAVDAFNAQNIDGIRKGTVTARTAPE